MLDVDMLYERWCARQAQIDWLLTRLAEEAAAQAELLEGYKEGQHRGTNGRSRLSEAKLDAPQDA